MSFGNFVPVHTQEIAANTLFKVKPEIRFESLPMLSPLYDGFTMRTKFYAVPLRLYIPELRKNRQQPWGSIPNFQLPHLTINIDQVPYNQLARYGVYSFAGSLMDMLGYAFGDVQMQQSFNNKTFVSPLQGDTVLYNGASISFNCTKLLAYFDCWMRGEYNPQDKLIPVLNEYIIGNGGEVAGVSDFRKYGFYKYLSYDSLKNFMDLVSGFSNSGTTEGSFWSHGTLGSSEGGAYIGALDLPTGSASIFDYEFLENYPLFTLYGFGEENFITPATQDSHDSFNSAYWSTLRNTTSNVGLLPVTYKGDYLSSWFDSEGIARLEQYAINNGESFLSLRQRNADFMIDLLSTISGDRYTDYLQFIFDTYLELKDHPILVGWDEIHFGANEDTTSTANTGDSSTGILGAVSSKARDYSNKVKPISFKSQEPLLLMVCSSIVPKVVYSQGVDRFDLKHTFADLWHPQYDSRGFQRVNFSEYYNPNACPVMAEQETYSVLDASILENFVAPYVPLGWEYMQHKDTVKGGMKLDRFRTWSSIREFDVMDTYGTDSTPDAVGVSQLTYINPLDGSLTAVPGGDAYSDHLENLSMWLNGLTSTYVKGAQYNLPFANVDAFDNQNFVVNYGFIVSQYQPITHNLITKTF